MNYTSSLLVQKDIGVLKILDKIYGCDVSNCFISKTVLRNYQTGRQMLLTSFEIPGISYTDSRSRHRSMTIKQDNIIVKPGMNNKFIS